jgi:hypothetical protein
MTAGEILARLERVRRSGGGWMALCPAHPDRNRSLSIRPGREGRILLHCWAGCPVEAICAALKIRVGDLFATLGEEPKPVPLAVRERAEDAAWRVADELGRVRRYYTDSLHRAERLQARIGEQMAAAQTGAEREAIWKRLARLAPISTFFVSAFEHINRLDTAGLIRFARMTPAGRRAEIFGESEARDAVAA